MKKLWSKQNEVAKLRGAAKKNLQFRKFATCKISLSVHCDFFFLFRDNYIYIRKDFFFLNCTVPALSSSCKASVSVATVGFRNFLRCENFLLLRNFTGVEKFCNPCEIFCVLLLAPTSFASKKIKHRLAKINTEKIEKKLQKSAK